MMNLIRADFYRISKSWVTYAPFVVLSLLHLVIIVGSLTLGNVPPGEGGLQYVEQLLSNGQLFFLIALIPFVFCVSVPIFSDGTMKNDISWGMSRTTLYVSKLLVLMILAVLLYVFFIGTGMATATAFFGLGNVAPGFWVNLLQSIGAQMVVILALCSLLTFLSFLLKKPYVLTEVLALVLLLPTVINWTGNLLRADLSWALYFDLTSTLYRFATFSLLDNTTILIGFGVAAVWFTVTFVAGIALLRKAEMK